MQRIIYQKKKPTGCITDLQASSVQEKEYHTPEEEAIERIKQRVKQGVMEYEGEYRFCNARSDISIQREIEAQAKYEIGMKCLMIIEEEMERLRRGK